MVMAPLIVEFLPPGNQPGADVEPARMRRTLNQHEHSTRRKQLADVSERLIEIARGVYGVRRHDDVETMPDVSLRIRLSFDVEQRVLRERIVSAESRFRLTQKQVRNVTKRIRGPSSRE